MVRFSVWLVRGYAHVFILLLVVIVTLPKIHRRHHRHILCYKLSSQLDDVKSTKISRSINIIPKECKTFAQKYKIYVIPIVMYDINERMSTVYVP